MVVRAEQSKLSILKHLNWLENHITAQKDKKQRAVHMERQTKFAAQQASQVMGRQKPTENEMEAEALRQGKLKKFNNMLQDADKKLKRAMKHQKFVEAQMKHLKATHKPGDPKVLAFEMKVVLAEKAAFYTEQLVVSVQHKIKAVGKPPPHVEVYLNSAARGQQSSMIQTAMQAAADELQTQHFKPAVLPNIWTPATADCKMGFVFARGTCTKGPYVYPKCALGVNGAAVTIEAGCGCGGQYMRTIMIGNVEKSSGELGLSTQMCVKDFKRHAEVARQKIFETVSVFECGRQIEEMCTAKAQRYIAAIEDKTTGLIAIKKNISDQKNQLINNQISVYQQSRSDLARTVSRLRHELATPAIWSAPIKYRKIPGMHFLDNGDLHPRTPFKSCKVMCSASRKCKSVSFRRMDNSCYMSSSTISYDDDFNCYLKKGERDAPSSDSFDTIPGMKIVTPDTQKVESKVDKVSLAECKGDCLNSDECKSISYSKSTGECLRAEVSLQYDSEWDYYDKDKSGLPKFDAPSYDVQVANERHSKVISQLHLAEKVMKKKQEEDDASLEVEARKRNVPTTSIMQARATDEKRENQPVVLPVPSA